MGVLNLLREVVLREPTFPEADLLEMKQIGQTESLSNNR